MGLNVSNANLQFKGTEFNENGVPYYKSNKGTTAGAIMAAPAVLINLTPLINDPDKLLPNEEINKYNDPTLQKYLKDYKNSLIRSKKYSIPNSIIACACTLGAGILFDKLRNDRAKQAANDIVTGNFNNIYANGGDIGVSATSVPYYKSHNGTKYGLLSGAICGLVSGTMNCIINKKFSIGTLLGCSLLFGLGGLLMGNIAQKSANKAAEKSTYIR